MRSIRALLVVGAIGLTALFSAAPTHAADQGSPPPVVHYVIDTSGSMSGGPLAEAKAAITTSASSLPSDTLVGVRSFGGGCGDGGNLALPIGLHGAEEIADAVSSLTASGGTPTGDALLAAASDLPPTGDRTIVLISDGQSGCGDPCTVAAQIKEQQGVDFRVHGVGFSATAAAQVELSCIADVTGGQYVSVDDQEGLEEALGNLTGGDQCADVLLLGLRGSGEDIDGEYAGLGKPVAEVARQFETTAPDGLDLRVKAVDYPAHAVPFTELLKFKHWLPNPNYVEIETYIDGMFLGADLARGAIDVSRATCTGEDEETIVLAGYSQGAAAAHMAWDRLSAADRSKVGLVLIGDPLRSKSSSIMNVLASPMKVRDGNGSLVHLQGGSLNGNAQDVKEWADFYALHRPNGGFVQEMCDDADPVCHAGDGWGVGQLRRFWNGGPLKALGGHTVYADSPYVGHLRLMSSSALAWAIERSDSR
jgi:hypothetical protein